MSEKVGVAGGILADAVESKQFFVAYNPRPKEQRISFAPKLFEQVMVMVNHPITLLKY